MIRRLIFAFILFSPFSAWLAHDKWLRFPVMILLLIMAVSFFILLIEFYKNPKAFFLEQEDYLLLLFLVIVWTAYFFGYFRIRSFNHSMSYTFSVFCYYLSIKFLIRRQGITIEELAKFAMYSTLLCNLIIITEWLLFNLAGFPIREYFLTGGEGTSNMDYYYQTFFYSVAGPGEEPGGTASLINILFPIGMWYLSEKEKPAELFFYVLFHMIAAVFMASAASIVFLIIAFLVSTTMYRFQYVYKYLLYFSLICFVFWSIYEFDILGMGTFLQKYMDYVLEKVSLSDTNYSSFDRKLKWQYAIQDWSNSPWIGNGPGHGTEVHSTGYFNTYLTLLADTGIFTFIIICVFYLISFLKINSLPDSDNMFFMFSMICQILHSSIYYVYYHEPFWFIFIMIQLVYIKRRDQKLVALTTI